MAPVSATGLDAIVVLRTKGDAQRSLWETLLSPEVHALSPGLEAIDRLLDDPALFEPHFDPEIGRR